MASITRCWKSRPASLLLLAPLLLSTGCHEQESIRFVTENVQVQPRNTQIDVRLSQELRLSRVATRAIVNGVPLVLELSVEVREAGSLTLVSETLRQYEIRYLPMSERVQLVDRQTGRVSSYPRLRHALRHLSDLRLTVPTPTLAGGDYLLRTRLRLDRASLPAPVQLPALIFRTWQHDSRWTQWPFRING